MIDTFLNDLILQDFKLLRKNPNVLNRTEYVVIQEYQGYVFNTRTTTRDEAGYAYINSFNLYLDPIIDVKNDDRILWNNDLYTITSLRKSVSKEINYTTLTLTYLGEN